MKLASLTTLAINMAVAFAADEAAGIRGSIPKLFGADQLADVGAHCDGCQPDYCYDDTERPNYVCYKSGFPKCCTKTKGNCPNGNKPGCECEGDCNPDRNDDDDDDDTNRAPIRDVCYTDEFNPCARGEYCRAAMGRCEKESGRCLSLPDESCSRNSDPVCGCDDQTYSNECVAYNAGVSILHKGECTNSDNNRGEKCFTDENTCARGEYCRAAMGRCENESGRCLSLPNDLCSREFDPVCGCDDQTYDSECNAYYEGVSILHKGECTNNDNNRGEKCFTDENTCARGKYCRAAMGRCENESGRCFSLPSDTCSREIDPVCGCDDQTYNNECRAYYAGVSILHKGRC